MSTKCIHCHEVIHIEAGDVPPHWSHADDEVVCVTSTADKVTIAEPEFIPVPDKTGEKK